MGIASKQFQRATKKMHPKIEEPKFKSLKCIGKPFRTFVFPNKSYINFSYQT